MAETGFRKKEGLSFKQEEAPLLWPVIMAILGGVLQTLTWPWPGLWPLCFVALVPLIVAVDGQSGRRAFGLGWVYGLSLSFSSLPWITEVLAGYGGLGPVLAWGVVALMSSYLALYTAFFGWIITLSLGRPLLWAILGAAAWCGVDWLKNWGPLGFNWTPLAGPLVLSPELGQTADLVGFYGLGFFVALVNFFLALNFLLRYEGEKTSGRPYLVAALVLVVAGFAYGWRQYPLWEDRTTDAPVRTVAAVQPSTDQTQKWDEAHRDKILALYASLAREAAGLKPWLVLWPETAMPFIYDYDYYETGWLRELEGEVGGRSLVGLAGISGFWPEQKLHNRMLLFQDGEPGPHYDKLHLVPFGEYIPFDWLPVFKWAFMQGIIGAAGTYSEGQPLPPIDVPLDPDRPDGTKVRLGILICFESIFPQMARTRVLEGADLLIVPTNDGWFGRSRAPEQHLQQAAMRAIETRRPLARAGNTGISAVIYPSGRIVWASELYDVNVFPLETPLLTRADLTRTFFVLHGYLLAPIMAALTGLLAVIRFFQKRK